MIRTTRERRARCPELQQEQVLRHPVSPGSQQRQDAGAPLGVKALPSTSTGFVGTLCERVARAPHSYLPACAQLDPN